MNKTAWIVLVGLALIASGCAQPEPGKPADKEKKAPATVKETSVAPQPITPVKEEAKPTKDEAKPAAGDVKSDADATEPAKKADTTETPKTDSQPKGSVLGAMGKALLKASTSSAKSKDLKAADEAPVGK